nr:flagellar biosynthetic protein FliO [Isachenkonia alkalipeptolytica]
MVVFVVALAYGTTWVIGKKSKGFMGGKNAKVLQQISLNMNFHITVIQVQQKVYIIGKTNKSIELLDTIPLDTWKENEAMMLNQEQENRKETPLERFFKIQNPLKGEEREKGDGN